MLSPDAFSPKASAPSIWSFDSGYVSNTLPEDEEQHNEAVECQATSSRHTLQHQPEENAGLGLGGLFNVHLGNRLQLIREETSIEPIVTKLSVFTTTESPNTDFLLPRVPIDGEDCLACNFWKATTGETTKCEDHRLPEIIEPSLLSLDNPKGKQPIRTLRTLPRVKAKVNMSATPARCSACELSALINPSQPTICLACAAIPEASSPPAPTPTESKVRRSRAGRNSKLPLQALTRLQAWLDANADYPYPSSEVKRQLAQDCNITEKQVTTWFTNARARQLSPLDTYLSSGSEDEGAHVSDIESAANTPTYAQGPTFLSDNQQRGHRAKSITGSSAVSGNRPQVSRRGKKKNYRRSTQAPTSELTSPVPQTTPTLGPNNNQDTETWQCTFCRRHLVPKSWRRHEETQHRPKAQWTCMLFGPRMTFPHRQGSSCAFCMAQDPSEDHFLRHHRITECAKRPTGERTFFRPDHLRQHVRNFHGATLYDVVQQRWKRAAEAGEGVDRWTCGFCGERLDTWDKRETHIANHFKEGMTMDQWVDWPAQQPKKQRGQQESQDKHSHSHSHGFGTLFKSPFAKRPKTPPSSQPQPATSFAHAYDPLAVSAPLPPHVAYCQPPMVPDSVINTDPFMMDGFVDWSQMPQMDPQIDQHFPMTLPVSDSSFDTSTQADFDSRLDSVLGFGNIVDHHGPWSQG